MFGEAMENRSVTLPQAYVDLAVKFGGRGSISEGLRQMVKVAITYDDRAKAIIRDMALNEGCFIPYEIRSTVLSPSERGPYEEQLKKREAQD